MRPNLITSCIIARVLLFVGLLAGLLAAPISEGAVVSFGTGSLIIPMDTGTAGQNNGMLRAYGLVYQLILNNVPVYWAINPAKAPNGDDFAIATTNSLQDVRTGASVVSPRSYRGGPFLIASADAAAALPIIQAWQATSGDQTAVHRFIAGGTFSPSISRQLLRAPRIAIVKDGNETIAFNNLNAAGIPDSIGGTWSSSSPDILTEADIEGPTTTNDSDGVLFTGVPGGRRYCFIASMHYNTTTHTDEVVQEVRSWLTNNDSGHLFLQCEAARVFENAVGGLFLTNAGLDDDGSATTMPVIRLPSHPLAQLDGTFEVDSGAVDSMAAKPGGYKTGVSTLINESTSSLIARIVLLTGRLDGSALNGRVTELAGHDYSTDLPITANPQTNGVRLFLNAILECDCAVSSGQADMTLTKTAPDLTSVGQIAYTIMYSNPGPQTAENVHLVDRLPAGTTYLNGSGNPAPTSVATGTLTWNLPPLTSGLTGIVTFQVLVAANGTYSNTATINSSHVTVRAVSSSPAVTVVNLPMPAPVISPRGGSFRKKVEVHITCQVAGAKIYYTTDGSDPTTSSQLYVKPFRLSGKGDHVVKAFAVKSGLTDSAVSSATLRIY